MTIILLNNTLNTIRHQSQFVQSTVKLNLGQCEIVLLNILKYKNKGCFLFMTRCLILF